MKVILKSFPKVPAMGAFSVFSALTAFDPDSVDVESEDEIYSAVVNLVANYLFYVLGLTESVDYH